MLMFKGDGPVRLCGSAPAPPLLLAVFAAAVGMKPAEPGWRGAGPAGGGGCCCIGRPGEGGLAPLCAPKLAGCWSCWGCGGRCGGAALGGRGAMLPAEGSLGEGGCGGCGCCPGIGKREYDAGGAPYAALGGGPMPDGSAGGGGCCISGRAGDPGMGMGIGMGTDMAALLLYAPPASGPPTGDDAMACGVLPRRTGRERSVGDGALPGGGGGGGGGPAPVGYCSIPLAAAAAPPLAVLLRDQVNSPTRQNDAASLSSGPLRPAAEGTKARRYLCWECGCANRLEYVRDGRIVLRTAL